MPAPISTNPPPSPSENTEALPISQWDTTHKIKVALERALLHLPAEVAAHIGEMIIPLTEALALLAISHAFGVGEIADAALFIVGTAALGLDAWRGGKEIGEFIVGSLNAQTETDLDKAGQHLAKAVSILGIDTLLTMVAHKAKGISKGEIAPTGEVEAVTPEGIRIRIRAPQETIEPIKQMESQGQGGSEVPSGEGERLGPEETSYGKNHLEKFRKHAEQIRRTTKEPVGKVSSPEGQEQIKAIIDNIVQNGESRQIPWGKEYPDAIWHKLGDSIVIRQANGEFITFLDYGKGGGALKWK